MLWLLSEVKPGVDPAEQERHTEFSTGCGSIRTSAPLFSLERIDIVDRLNGCARQLHTYCLLFFFGALGLEPRAFTLSCICSPFYIFWFLDRVSLISWEYRDAPRCPDLCSSMLETKNQNLRVVQVDSVSMCSKSGRREQNSLCILKSVSLPSSFLYFLPVSLCCSPV